MTATVVREDKDLIPDLCVDRALSFRSMDLKTFVGVAMIYSVHYDLPEGSGWNKAIIDEVFSRAVASEMVDRMDLDLNNACEAWAGAI